jgi:hypothetical protein
MNFAYEQNKIRKGLGAELFDSLSKIDCFLAGGAMVSIYNNKPVEDYDIYVKSPKDAFKIIRELEQMKFVCVAKTNRSALFCLGAEEDKILINLIFFHYFNNLQEVFNLFDFTVCMGGYDFKNKSFDFHPAFFRDNLLKRLFYSNKSKYPIGALIRIGKYRDKDFTISKKELLKIVLHCQKLEINTIEELEDQVGTIYGCNLKEIVGEEFDINDIIEKLDSIEDQDFTPSGKQVLDTNWKEELSVAFEVISYSHGDHSVKKFYVLDDIFIDEAPKDAEATRKVEFPIFLYKYVKETETEGVFCSFMRNSFKYKLGEEFDAGSHGSYCGPYSLRKDFTYSNYSNAVLVKIKVQKPEDIVAVNPVSPIGTTVRKGIVEEVVSNGKGTDVVDLF